MITRKLASVVIAAALGTVALATQALGMVLADGRVNPMRDDRIPGVLIVNFKTSSLPFAGKTVQKTAVMGLASIDALNARYGLASYRELFPGAEAVPAPRKEPDLRGYHVLEFDPSVDLDAAAADYQSDPNVESVEYDFYAYVMRTPNDPSFPSMWELNQSSDHDIDAPEAWDRTVGNSITILADTDTGTLYTHEDLIDNIWVNPGEDLDSDGVVMDPDDMNGVDDDHNGYIDDLIGYDFVASGSSVWPGEDGSIKDNDPKDFNGHGTHTAGTICATTNNGKGVAGVAGGFGPPSERGCKLMCLRMGYSYDDGGFENARTQMDYVAEAFRYAASNGAVAINYSFGSVNGGGIGAATDYAVSRGVVICAAAGNDNSSSTFGYLQLRSDVVCVASTSSNDVKSSFSNYGTPVDVSAPGSNILSTFSSHYTPGYAVESGTSMAAPHVVGLVGLIRSLNPALTRQEVVNLIVNNADNIDALNPLYAGKLGSGRINAYKSTRDIAVANFGASPMVGDAPLLVQFSDSSSTVPTAWHWNFGDGDTSSLQNPSHTYAPGLYDFTLSIQTGTGDATKTKLNYVSALADTVHPLDTLVLPGHPAMIAIWARNSQPVNEIDLPVTVGRVSDKAYLDSIVTTGCRTSYFDRTVVFDNSFNGEQAVILKANTGAGAPPLPAGDGMIAKVWLRIKPTAAPLDSFVVTVGPLSSYTFQFVTPVVTFTPHFNSGALIVGGPIGDLNGDGHQDIFDVLALIQIAFNNGAPPNPPGLADINCDGVYNVTDVLALINFVFSNGAAPCS